ncbi:M67 family metallopeptidase, partial [Dolichospermum sp. ST_sed10]|nr:M67 family metallopeptidase [Dolichospermum sp. ST_sed10]
MNLQLKTNHIEIIKNHAKKTYPDECCGLILGYINNEYKIAVEIIPTENVWNTEKSNFTADQEDSTSRRYAISPQVMLQTQKEARNRNLNIIGIYHSHPDYPAIPSEWDRIYAWTEYSYVILSLQNAQAGKLQSWTLDDNHQFQAETIKLINLA